MRSERTNTWPTMGPPRDDRGLPKRWCSHDEDLDLSKSINFTRGSVPSNCKDGAIYQMELGPSCDRKTGWCSKYTSNQWMTLVGLAFGNYAIGACVSLQAPFFPQEAERKGATATEYGIVFGVYQLTFLLGSFFFGKMVAYVPPNFMLISGIFIVGCSSILFGVLDRAPSHSFIPLALSVRIAEGIGSIAAKTATYSIIGVQFPDTIATTIASMETCLGVGLIVGPTMGGALYQLGGYPTPFMVTGVLLLINACVILTVLPRNYDSVEKSGELFRFWKHPSVLLNSFVVFISFLYVGFLGAALEPHIRKFELSPLAVGTVFIVAGGTYAMTAPAWGALIDKGLSADLLTVFGCLVVIVSEAMIGPASIFHADSKLWMVIVALILYGVGAGAKLVSIFISCLRMSISRGFPNDRTTFGLVSTMYGSSLSLGSFAGPTLGGYLLDVWGFTVCCTALMIIEATMMVLLVFFIVCPRQNAEQKTLLEMETSLSKSKISYSKIS